VKRINGHLCGANKRCNRSIAEVNSDIEYLKVAAGLARLESDKERHHRQKDNFGGDLTGCLLISENEIQGLPGTFPGVFQDFSGTHTG